MPISPFSHNLYLGLDFGTSGARACVVNADESIVHEDHIAYPDPEHQTPLDWREALLALLRRLPDSVSSQLQGIAIAATSGTVLLCDEQLEPVSPALLYSDSRASKEALELEKIAPPNWHGKNAAPDDETCHARFPDGTTSHSTRLSKNDNQVAGYLPSPLPEGEGDKVSLREFRAKHTVCSATSGLAKFMWLTRHSDLSNAVFFLHQADWLTALLTGMGGISDYHNALKTGYDVESLCWPDWIQKLPHTHLLPRVVAPGAAIAQLHSGIALHFGINPGCTVHAGTTDSIAAFIAAGVHEPGVAVTSLGTTIVLKLLSERRVEAAQYGVYSHRYGDLWLAGGASNAGGSVLRQYFSAAQLAELSNHIDPSCDSPLDYYPLPRPGERFPIHDPALAPHITPRPVDDVQFLHGLLQGLSRIEARGYARLAELGANPLKSVATCGGGSKNLAWQKMRERLLGVPVHTAQHTEAAYGAALLAARGHV